MASKLASLFQDLHSNGGSLVGKGDAFKTQKKGGLGGRKPLGDLSNSGKPALTQASTKKPLKELIDDASNKKGFSKASDKVQNRSRKVLSDISNTQQPQVQKNNTKLSVVAEEPRCPAAIAGEGFLHNHDECIKSHTQAKDMDEFLRTLINDCSKHIASPRAPPRSSKFEPERPPWFLDLVEVEIPESPPTPTPPPCKSPKWPDCYSDSLSVPLFVWEDCHFELMKTP